LASLPDTLGCAKAEGTLRQYSFSWGSLIQWAERVNITYLPLRPLYAALYLHKLLQQANTFSVIKTASAAINAFHELAGHASPTSAPIVKAVREAARRLLPEGAHKKEALLLEHVVQICERFAQSGCAERDLWICAAIAVAFAGFFRYSDLAHIYVDWIVFHPNHMEIFLETRKNDQYREGHWIVLARWPGSIACPLKLVRRLIDRLGLKGHRPLFAAFTGSSYGTEPAPYRQVHSAMLDKFEAIGLDKSNFGTQSCRAGGATLVANMGIPDRVWMEHGGWRSTRAARGYIKTAVATKLQVTQAMLEHLNLSMVPGGADGSSEQPPAGQQPPRRGPKGSKQPRRPAAPKGQGKRSTAAQQGPRAKRTKPAPL
jgi:hypothetical protein